MFIRMFVYPRVIFSNEDLCFVGGEGGGGGGGGAS